MLLCVAMEIRVSPNCVSAAPNKFSSSTVNLQAMVLARAVIIAVNSQEFIITSPQHYLMLPRTVLYAVCQNSVVIQYMTPYITDALTPYTITGPAIVSIFAPTPRMKPSAAVN